MNVGVGYIVCNSECHLCFNKWIGIIEVDFIDILGVVEYKKPLEIECPNCETMTDNFTVLEIKN